MSMEYAKQPEKSHIIASSMFPLSAIHEDGVRDLQIRNHGARRVSATSKAVLSKSQKGINETRNTRYVQRSQSFVRNSQPERFSLNFSGSIKLANRSIYLEDFRSPTIARPIASPTFM